MQYRASRPEGVAEKIAECRFFLTRMKEYEAAKNVQDFLYCLSAFLSAFRATIYRASGVLHALYGDNAKQNMWTQLKASKDIWFLKDATDLEVHGDGARMWQVNVVNRFTSRWDPSRRSRFVGRLEGRFRMGPSLGVGSSYIQFEDHPTGVIELCHACLDRLEGIATKPLTASTSATP